MIQDNLYQFPKVKWNTPPKAVGNNWIVWDFQVKTNEQMMMNQLDLLDMDKVVVTDVATSCNSKKEHERLKKYQGLTEHV